MKTFMLLCAIPGSGKSTWSEEYRLTHKNVFIVSSDTIRKELGTDYQDFTHEDEVWKKFLDDILKYRDAADDVTVIADSTNIINKFRKYYAETVTGFDKKVLVVFHKDLDTILKQNKVRCKNRIVPDDAIIKMWNSWEEPTEEIKAMYDEIIEVNNWFESPDVKRKFHYQ